MSAPEPIYLDLATESENPVVTELETVCMNCLEQGTTRMLLTLIPHFREVMISSFSCPHCNHSNSSLLSTGDWQDKGIKFTLDVKNIRDLKRMLVKSDFASIKIPEVELEVPGRGDKGEITSVEGVINKAIEGLSYNQQSRREEQPELAEQLENYISQLKALLEVSEPFTLIMNDPTGNSFIERLAFNGVTDPQLTSVEYDRPPELENSMMAAQEQNKEVEQNQLAQVAEEDEDNIEEAENEESANKTDDNPVQEEEEEEEEEDFHKEVIQFNTICDRCHRPAETNMKVTNIPHFKEVIIMATVCDACGNKTNEVKSGGGISEKGKLITLTMEDSASDLARDVLKSETCSVQIPQMELEVGAGVLGGRFTTLEGLLVSIKADMESNPFFMGDSIEEDRKNKVKSILSSINKVIEGKLLVTIKLDDPAGSSYLQNLYAPDPDPCVEIVEYTRSFEQNEDLGLNDMKTEGYEES